MQASMKGPSKNIPTPFLHRIRLIFLPTCSAYTIEAIQNFGIIKGIWLGMKRILRCRPGCSCGIDPIPKIKG